MKKLSIFVISMFLILFAPTYVDAISVNVTVSCSNVLVGSTTTCTLKGTASSGEVTGIEAKFQMSGGATIESVSQASGWDTQENTTSSILYIAGARNFSGSFNIATLTIRGNSAGLATLNVTGIKISDQDYATISVGSTQATLGVTAPTTSTTTRPPTQAPTTTTTTRTVTQKNLPSTVTADVQETTVQPPQTTELKLDSVTVDDFEVSYVDGKYYVTVNSDTESVEVRATADPNITIIGQGVRTLATGKNVVELILRNESNQSTTIQVIITKPDDTNDHNTLLSLLKVVNYNFTFNKDTKEYTIFVPSNVDEIYIIAKTDNKDASIIGDGLKELKKGNNEIYIRVQYGDKESSEYIIHVKRSYNSLIMLITIGLLTSGLIGFAIFFIVKQKSLSQANINEKNKILAEANRAVVNSKEAISVNGQNVFTPGRLDLTPKQVVDNRVPTNPVAIATSTISPDTNINNGEQQVKVVQTGNPVPVKTINTNEDKTAVINTGE